MTLRRPLAGKGRSYLYVLCSKTNHVLYVGETAEYGGVCARFAGHIGRDGTFRARLLEKEGIGVEEIDDLEIFAFALPTLPEYLSRDASWRK